jgi:hypothetical protein
MSSELTNERVAEFANMLFSQPPRYSESDLADAEEWLRKLAILRNRVISAGLKAARIKCDWAYIPELTQEQKNQLQEIQAWENYINEKYFPTKNFLTL